MTTAFLVVDGVLDVRVKSFVLSRSLGALLGAATVTRPIEHGARLSPGASVEVYAVNDGEDELLLTGQVDAVSGSYDSHGGEMSFEVRDRTADLVDGTKIDQDLSWWSPTLYEVASKIADSFGIELVDEVGAAALKLPPQIQQPGEPAFDALSRAARLHGVLPSTSASGALVLSRVERRRAGGTLRSGKGGNVLRASWRNDHSQRFRRTRILSQGLLGLLTTGLIARPYADSIDEGVRAGRELVIVTEEPLLGDEIQGLADWHSVVARARGASVTIETASWRIAPRGETWKPGMLCAVELPEIEIEGEMLIDAVELSISDAGERAVLGLVAPEAYAIDPTEAARLRRGGVEALVE